MARKKKDENFLDQVPARNPAYVWGEGEETGVVTVTVPHRGVFDRAVQLLFHKPAYSLIDLDVYGSFIWKRIDGVNTVYEIAQMVTEEFGAQAEPLYNRLVAFFGILKSHKFVTFGSGAVAVASGSGIGKGNGNRNGKGNGSKIQN